MDTRPAPGPVEDDLDGHEPPRIYVLNFRDSSSHDATVVRGPQGFATKTVLNKNQRFRFTVPGEYKLYCSIHPVLMAQVVKVR